MKITVLGDGGWGTTLSVLLSGKGHKVDLWGAFPDYVEYLKNKRENIKFLPGIKIPKEIKITNKLDEALDGAEALILCVPSQFLREVLFRLKSKKFEEALIISAIKGIEIKSLKRMSEVICEILGQDVNMAVISGPSIALEVANGVPTTVVAASNKNIDTAKKAQEMFMTDKFRVYTSDDIVGVEFGGSVKNVIAIAAGINDGLGYGSNSKSALIVRGMVEIARLGVALGARAQTFWGLSGIGDLITTCISEYGRNRWFGEELGRGKKPIDVVKETEMVIEGFGTTKSVYELAKKNNIEMPITEKMYGVLYENKSPKDAVYELMTRQPKAEG